MQSARAPVRRAGGVAAEPPGNDHASGRRGSRARPVLHHGRQRRRPSLSRASIGGAGVRLDTCHRDVARGRRRDAPPPPAHRASRDGGRARRARRARPLGCQARPAPARRDREDSGRDRRRGSRASGRACGAPDGGRTSGDGAERDARPDRVSVQGAGCLRAEASALRRRRVARASDAALRRPRVRRALRAGRRRASGRPRPLDGGNRARIGTHEPARRRPPASCPPGRRTSTRLGNN